MTTHKRHPTKAIASACHSGRCLKHFEPDCRHCRKVISLHAEMSRRAQRIDILPAEATGLERRLPPPLDVA